MKCEGEVNRLVQTTYIQSTENRQALNKVIIIIRHNARLDALGVGSGESGIGGRESGVGSRGRGGEPKTTINNNKLLYGKHYDLAELF